MWTPSEKSAKTWTVWREEQASHFISLLFYLTSRIHLIAWSCCYTTKRVQVTCFFHFWRVVLHVYTVWPWSDTLSQLDTSAVTSNPCHTNWQTKLFFEVPSRQTVMEHGHNVDIIHHQLVSKNVFFIYSVVKFVFLWLNFLFRLRTACRLCWISSCHSSNKGCCMWEFGIKRVECSERL